MKTLNEHCKEQETRKQNWKNKFIPMKYTDDHGIKCDEMRKLRYCSDGYIYVSKQSFEKEMCFRRDRIKEGVEYDLPKWEELEIYSN